MGFKGRGQVASSGHREVTGILLLDEAMRLLHPRTHRDEPEPEPMTVETVTGTKVAVLATV